MSTVVVVLICLALVVVGVPVLFCVGYLVFVCVGYLVFVYVGDAFEFLADMGIDAGERIAETIDREVFGK